MLIGFSKSSFKDPLMEAVKVLIGFNKSSFKDPLMEAVKLTHKMRIAKKVRAGVFLGITA